MKEFDFEDDGKLRVVVFLGHMYLKSAPKDVEKVIIEYRGPALDVISQLSVHCNEVEGNVEAGTSVHCDAVGGDVTAGTSVNCDSVGGNVSAGTNVSCDDVKGSVTAGTSVTASKITGNVTAPKVIVKG